MTQVPLKTVGVNFTVWLLRSIGLQGGPKNWHTFLYALPSYALKSSNIGRFVNLFQCLNQENICNNPVTKGPITPQVCRYTTL